MSAFAKYMHAQETTRAARNLRDYASASLELATIRERLAELASQHEPLSGLVRQAGLSCDDPTKSPRDALYAAAFYAVVGRMPE